LLIIFKEYNQTRRRGPAGKRPPLKTFNYRASVSHALPALERNARAMQNIGILRADVDVDRLVQEVFVALPGVPDSLF
jgi:hypothetical protein